MSADQDFLDRLLAHTFNLLRATSGAVREHQAQLERVHRQIIKLIVGQDDLTAAAQARASVLIGLLGRVDKAIKAGYKRIAALAQRQLAELATVESSWVARASREAMKAPADIVQAISKDFAQNLATQTRVEGTVLSDWWEKQQTDTRIRYHQSIRKGFETGTHPKDIVKEINETVLPTTKRHVEGVVRTSFMEVSQTAHLETYRRNADLYDGVEFLARLDDKTTLGCIALDGTKWTLDGEPIGGHSIDFLSSKPPRHWGCRSRLAPVHKAFERVKRNPDAPPAMRRAMDGKRPAKTRFEDLLNQEGEAFQDKMLGPKRAKLFRQGKLSLREMVDTSGQPIKISDLDLD